MVDFSEPAEPTRARGGQDRQTAFSNEIGPLDGRAGEGLRRPLDSEALDVERSVRVIRSCVAWTEFSFLLAVEKKTYRKYHK